MTALGAGVFTALACLFLVGGAFAETGSALSVVLLVAAAASLAVAFLLLTARAERKKISK